MAESYKIISGEPLAVEAALNRLVADDEWMPIVWGITPDTAGSVVTCVLISARILQRSQLLHARQMTAPGSRQ